MFYVCFQVRRTAASKLYESLITLDEMVGEDDLSELLSLLGETDWLVGIFFEILSFND